MIDVRPFDSLGHANHGWLDARHHFSFADYHDPKRVHWGALRVWNDDLIAANSGFPPHPHRDMEIITYVREGAISHEDSLGNKGRTVAGDIQVMSAGTGIVHAEYNREDIATRLFQIWIMADRAPGQPNWGTKPFPRDERSGQFVVMASGKSEDTDALPIRTDARVLAATLERGATTTYVTEASRHLYLVPAKGAVEVNGIRVNERDGAAITDLDTITVTAIDDAEIVMVDAA